jgi:hypothetical protein
VCIVLAYAGMKPRPNDERKGKMAIEFYDVKKREKVQIDESQIKKVKYEKTAKDGKVNTRYAFRAENEGTKLTKFASKDDWDALDAPEE